MTARDDEGPAPRPDDEGPATRDAAAAGYRAWVNRFSTTAVGRWLARSVAARLDPVIYRLSGGRFTTTIVPSLPMLVLTTTGRRTGRPRSVQLAYLRDGDDLVVVASNFGEPRHPGWMHNLLARSRASVLVDGERREVVADTVTDAELEALWPRLDALVPQFETYRARTDRDIVVFRLRPADAPTPGP